MADFITLNEANVATEHLCCIIRSKKPHPGVEAKRAWLCDRIPEGHTFRKLDAKGCCFIEYAPLETAWVPIVGENFLYIYCLWVLGDLRGQGYAKDLIESCISDAKAQGKSGICMLGAKKQKNWLSSQDFAKKYGFTVTESTPDGYDLLTLSFDGSLPHFAKSVTQEISDTELTVYYSRQCPFILQKVDEVKAYTEENGIPARFILVDSLESAKSLPCVFNNFAYFYKGKFISVNLLDVPTLKKLLAK